MQFLEQVILSWRKSVADRYFPLNSPFGFLGRAILLTFTPPNCRRRQQLGEPNRFLSILIKLAFKIYLDLNDEVWSDPAEPTLAHFRDSLAEMNLYSIDHQVSRRRALSSQRTWIAGLCVLSWILVVVYAFCR